MRQRMLWIYHYLDYNFICNEIYYSEHQRYSPWPPHRNHFYYSLDWVSTLPGWSIKAIVWESFSYFCWVSGQEACLRIMTCMRVYRIGRQVCAVPRERLACGSCVRQEIQPVPSAEVIQESHTKIPTDFQICCSGMSMILRCKNSQPLLFLYY